MKPLHWIAMGLVIVLLSARFGSYDALADPIGWMVALLGLRGLADLPDRRLVTGLAVAALVVSAVLWWPATQAWLDGEDPSLRWALALPQLGFQATVCRGLARRAAAASEPTAARWLTTAWSAVALMAVLPLVAIALRSAAVESTTNVAAALASILVVWLLFAYGSRPWALPTDEAATPGGAAAS